MSTAWIADALCAQVDPELWVPDHKGASPPAPCVPSASHGRSSTNQQASGAAPPNESGDG